MKRIYSKKCRSGKIKAWLCLMQFGAAIGCHQMPERSFFYKGYQFPLCARCTGLFIGYLLGIIVWFIYPFSLVISAVLCIPMAVDGSTQYLRLRVSTQCVRLLTGILGGIGITMIEIKGLQMIWSFLYNTSMGNSRKEG